MRWALLALVAVAGGCGKSSPFHDGINAPEANRSTLDEGPFLPLGTQNGRIVDAAGRDVILRGVEHHALQDVPYIGREVLPEDYPLIASWGFTTVRMAISWSRIEPMPGQYDDGYIAEIRAAMDACQAAGITVVLEWHQDLWGKCAATLVDNTANGAPDWTCPNPVPAVGALFDRLWQNQDGLFDSFLAAWGHVLGVLGNHPALLGLDVFNEPTGTAQTPALERDYVYPAYRRIVPALRAAFPKGLLFLDATLARNDSMTLYTEPLDSLGAGVVFAPHLYTGWLKLYLLGKEISPDDKAADFAAARAQAAALHLPLWDGEWGVNLNLDTALADLETHVGLEDTSLIGSSYWAFERAVPTNGNSSISGAQSILDVNRQVRQPVVDRLSRPYPIQSPGTLAGLEYDFSAARLTVTIDVTSVTSPLVLYAPARELSAAQCLSVTGPGAWHFDQRADRERVLVGFDAPGRYVVTLAKCE
jgi:hypothetical protein